MLWQGLRQVKAKGRAPTPWHRGLDLFFLFFSAVKVSCPSNLQLQMGATWAWTCDGIVGPTTFSARGNADGWRSWSQTWPRTMEPRLCSTTRSWNGWRRQSSFLTMQCSLGRSSRRCLQLSSTASRPSARCPNSRATSRGLPRFCEPNFAGLPSTTVWRAMHELAEYGE